MFLFLDISLFIKLTVIIAVTLLALVWIEIIVETIKYRNAIDEGGARCRRRAEKRTEKEFKEWKKKIKRLQTL